MAVPEQTPYIEHIGNGVTTSFSLKFQCESKDHLIVLVDEIEPPIATWILTDGNVVFTTAPAAGKKIKLQRNTPFGRTTNYQSFNNSFRPQTVNIDFDRIWWKLQELGVADWLMKLYVDRLHQQQEEKINNLKDYVDVQDADLQQNIDNLRLHSDQQDSLLQQNIENLKGYVDDKDDELRNYLLSAIQEQGVALDQLEEYYSYLMQQLAQVAIDRGWAASFIVSADGSTQQQVNDRIGNTWYAKPLGYELNARVMLTNGDIVKSTVADNVIDPNLDMTGWVKTNSTGQIVDDSGQNQKQVNDGLSSIAEMLAISEAYDGQRVYVKSYYTGLSGGGGVFVYDSTNTSIYDGGVSFGKWRRLYDILTPQHFGVQGAFSTKTLADFYATLSDAQTLFPLATALSNLHDRVAFSTYLKYLIANSVRTDWTCQILLDVPLPSYTVAKTALIDGALELKSHQTYLRYCFHIATNELVLTGSIKVFGTQSAAADMRTRYIDHGVVCGTTTSVCLTGTAENCDFGTIIGSSILGYALALLRNCHFSRARQVRGANAGSANNHPTYKYLQGVVDDFTLISNSGGTTEQRSVLQLTEVDVLSKITFLETRLRVLINNLPYDVLDIDTGNKQITIYPHLPASLTTGTLMYVWGGAVIVESNNTACTSASTVEAIVCGYGLSIPALYGIAVDSFTSEFCGIGIGVANRGEAHIGTALQLAYFEGNKVDILYGWNVPNHSTLRILQTIALNPEKIHNMAAYTNGESRRRDWATMGGGEVYLISGSPITVERSVWELHSQNTNNTVVVGGSLTANIAYNPKIAELTARRQKTINLVRVTNTNTSAVVTINPPSGYTVNGGASVSLDMNNYTEIVSVTLYVPFSYDVLPTDIKVVITGQRKVLKGTSEQRPSNPVLGLRYYDTTLLPTGKPIEWDGSAWVDSTGATV